MSFDDGSVAFRLRQELKSCVSDVDAEPLEISNFRYGDFELVGHGSVTNKSCGLLRSFVGCPNVDLHDRITLDGENYKGKVFVKPVFFSCDKPSCPRCYKFGWAVKEAGKIELRLAEGSKHFGLVEHIVATVPPEFFHLGFEDLKVKILKVLADRMIIGGVMIFHAFRHRSLSPHFHVLGYILDGYGKCRSCVRSGKKCFRGCGGWEDLKYRAYERDGCIVRVMGERITVGGTAWYQLNHASIDVSKKRARVVTWFGVCSYHRLKVSDEVKKAWIEKRKQICPVCRHDLVPLRYFGRVALAFGSGFPKRGLWMDAYEDGQFVWAEDTHESWRKG